jgi:hypothetical protein
MFGFVYCRISSNSSMSNWKIFMESQDREPELELSLSQLPDPPLQLLQPPTRDEVGPSKRRKRPRVE